MRHPHLTGGAVDLTLGDGDGRPLDMGTDSTRSSQRRGPGRWRISPSRRDRRRLLFWTMSAQGFTAYREEWWHSIGDQFWARVRAARAPGADLPH